jgi:hypothetical protein
MMRFMWPRSVVGLVLIGFSFVALPLLFATLRAGIAVDDLTARTATPLARRAGSSN